MSNTFPKTLEIRNTPDGCIWQIYHVKNQTEADLLTATAAGNGFYGISLVDYRPSEKETWPGWRKTDGWRSRIDAIRKRHQQCSKKKT